MDFIHKLHFINLSVTERFRFSTCYYWQVRGDIYLPCHGEQTSLFACVCVCLSVCFIFDSILLFSVFSDGQSVADTLLDEEVAIVSVLN